nr:GDSL esterase/lipase At5g45960-like [Ipomoea batatas]
MASPLVFFILHLIIFFPTPTIAVNHYRPFNNTVPAVFVFGDSTVDPGNNNFIDTVSRCDFPPYGRDFDPNHTPTGRFTNGRLVTDFIVSYAGIKDYVPPYLDSSLSIEELMTGVSFASGGTGYDPFTAQINGGVIPVLNQLEYFREYRRRVEKAVGKEKTEMLIRNAVFLLSAGTNDMLANYYLTPFRRQTYSVSQYHNLMLQLTEQFLQGLMKEGAHTIAVVGLPPIGCLPIAITALSDNMLSRRRCVDKYSAVARQYNSMLQNKLKAMQTPSTRILYADIYNPLEDIAKNPTKYGFEAAGQGCCGSGYFEFSILCNPKSVVCPDASKYVFWDAVHPTEATFHMAGIKSYVPPVLGLKSCIEETNAPASSFALRRPPAMTLFCPNKPSYMGVKENVPPYLDQSLGVEELITGVSFASGGTGYDAFTAKSNGGVITVERQLQYFREYKKRLENLIGKEKTKWVVRNAAFFVSAGTNDLNNYFGTPSLRRQQYTLPAYQQFLIQLVQQFVLGLMEEGAQRIGVVGLPPIGCLPTTITRNSDSPLFHRHCLPTYSAAAREYNQLLQNKLKTMQNGALKLVYIDIFNPLEDMIQNPRKFGFNEVNRGCCGSGLFELSVLCNPESIVCSDASKYMFWDAVHPTQATYSQLFKALVPTIDYIIKG